MKYLKKKKKTVPNNAEFIFIKKNSEKKLFCYFLKKCPFIE